MYQKHGAYYLVKGNKWIPLGKVYSEAMAEYARRTDPGNGMAELVNKTLDRLDVKPGTMRQYKEAARKIIPAFAEFAPNQVQTHHINKFLDHYRKTPYSANRIRTVLKMAFDNAVDWGEVPFNPVIASKRNKEKPRTRYLEDPEFIKIRDHARPWLAILMELLYLTGQRVMDIVLLQESSIRDGEISIIQQKTGQRVEIELSDDIEDCLNAARSLRSVRSIYLFHTGRGKPYSYFSARDAYVRACKAAGVEGTTLRDIRAKSATDAEGEGINPTILLGHGDAQTTKRYLRKRRVMRSAGPSRVLDSNQKS